MSSNPLIATVFLSSKGFPISGAREPMETFNYAFSVLIIWLWVSASAPICWWRNPLWWLEKTLMYEFSRLSPGNIWLWFFSYITNYPCPGEALMQVRWDISLHCSSQCYKDLSTIRRRYFPIWGTSSKNKNISQFFVSSWQNLTWYRWV